MDKIETVQEDDVTLSFKEDTVHISGNIVQMKPELYMQNFFKELHQYVLEHKIKRIYVNITKLKFLNSAGIKVLIDWIILITELPEDEKYQLFFICNSKSFWQETSINTLAIIDSHIVNCMRS
ncbi:MAG: SiaC family regulatory phosphoprotein [Spirochaetales bacterium]|nr:SiaC family regulatory phosphoprotein [Spirochaetales bacterium]